MLGWDPHDKEVASQPILSKHVRTLQLQPEEHNRRPTDVEIREALFLTNVDISISSQCDFKRIIRFLMAYGTGLMLTHARFACTWELQVFLYRNRIF